jgi:hypothetical protein
MVAPCLALNSELPEPDGFFQGDHLLHLLTTGNAVKNKSPLLEGPIAISLTQARCLYDAPILPSLSLHNDCRIRP